MTSYDGLEDVVHRTPGLTVQFWHKGDLYATADRFVFRSRDKGISWKKIARLDPAVKGILGQLRDWIARLKSVRKLRARCGPNLRVLEDGTTLVAAEGIYTGSLEEQKIVRLKNTHKGPMMLSQGWTDNHKSAVYFGEYQTGKHTMSRLFWSQDKGRSWKVCLEFSRNEIRHIHAVAYDPYRDLLWVTTGDSDAESRILYSSDQGATFQVLGGGTQEWRAVSLQFTPKAIYWGTDSPKRWNRVYRWDWDLGSREALLTIRNPFYYSAQDGRGNLYFSTTAERPEIDTSTIFSEIWVIQHGKLPRRLVRWPKGKLKGYGIIKFAQGRPPNGWLAFTPVNLTGHHCETLVLQMTK
jgi:hypothetical protein